MTARLLFTAFCLLVVLATFKIVADSMAIPANVPVPTPQPVVVTTPGVQHVSIDNWPTGTVTTTPWPLMTKTPGLPMCPVKHGQQCQVGARVNLKTPVPTPMPVYCTAKNLAMMAPRTVCEWVEPTAEIGLFR